jgi:hypothetical protein
MNATDPEITRLLEENRKDRRRLTICLALWSATVLFLILVQAAKLLRA